MFRNKTITVTQFVCRPQPKDERTCSCFFQKDIKTAREKERIKQFSIWYAEVDKFKQEEYIKRRRKRRHARQHRARRLWKYRTLLIPAMLLMIAGSFLLVAANVPFLGLGDWFQENRRKLTVLGGFGVGLGVLVFMIEQGLLSHYANARGLKLFVQFGNIPSQNPIPQSETGDSRTDFVQNEVPYKPSVLHKERESARARSLHAADSLDTACSEDTAEALNDSDPLLPRSDSARSKPKQRPPKLSEITKRQKDGRDMSSVDTAESALTEITQVSSERSSLAEHLGILTADAVVYERFPSWTPPGAESGGVSEEVVSVVSSNRDTAPVTLQSCGSKDLLLG